MKTAQQIFQDNSLDELSGGILKNLRYDMLKHQVSFDVDVLEYGVHTFYQLVFLGVVEFLVQHDKVLQRWHYVDLTSIEIERDGDLYNIGAELWESEMIIKCQEVNFTVMDVKK